MKVIFSMDNIGNITAMPLCKKQVPSLFFQMEEDKNLLFEKFFDDDKKKELESGWPVHINVELEDYEEFLR